jgi:sugar O-acyltransferase (sialic acid O-acetyltransferase NeuD family)
MGKPLIIVGEGEFAEIACEYFTHDSEHDVVAFAVEQAFLKKTELLGHPVVPLEDLETRYAPEAHEVFVAVTYTQLNRVRTRLLRIAREKGFKAATYISSKAFVWQNARVGENCFVFENNVIQYHASIGDNVILWSGNHIGHRAVIGDNCFVSSHVVVSGYCTIGENCFLGVNSTLGDRVKLGRDCVLGAGAVLLKDCDDRRLLRGNPAVIDKADPLRIYRVKGES